MPDTLKPIVDEQVSQRGYGTSSEYARELLLAGAASAPTAPTDVAYFEGLRNRVREITKAGDQPA